MTENKATKAGEDRRAVELSEGRKGIIVMPAGAMTLNEVLAQAPTGLPAPQQAKPPTPVPPPTPEK
jgi:hypothetical protein